MPQRLKVFTFISGTGATVIESPLEDQINDWLQKTNARIVKVSQSESEHRGEGHHVTICVWYEPE